MIQHWGSRTLPPRIFYSVIRSFAPLLVPQLLFRPSFFQIFNNGLPDSPHQISRFLVGEVAGGHGFAHTDVHGSGPEAPPVPGKHLIRSGNRNRNNRKFGVPGQEKSPALEFLHLPIRAPGSLGENNDGNPLLEEGRGLLQAPERRLSTLPVDENMAGEIQNSAEDGEPEEGFFGQEPHRERGSGNERGYIQDAGVVGDQNIGLILLQVLHSFQADMNAVGPEKPVDPEALEEGRPSPGGIQETADQSRRAENGGVNGGG